MQSSVMESRERAARIVAEHYLPVWRYLRFLGCADALADDLAQETFVALLNRSPDLEDSEALSAYLRSIAKNLYFKSLRKSKSEPAWRNLDEADAAWERTPHSRDWQPYREAVRSCLEGLDEGDRDLLAKYYGRKESRAEAAAAVGRTEEGLKTHLRRLKDRLKRCIKGKLNHD